MAVEAPSPILEAERKQAYIDSIRFHIADYSQTDVISKKSDPNTKSYKLKFNLPDIEIGWVEIKAEPDSLFMERAEWTGGLLQRTRIIISEEGVWYKVSLEDGLTGEEALNEAEKNKDLFLPAKN